MATNEEKPCSTCLQPISLHSTYRIVIPKTRISDSRFAINTSTTSEYYCYCVCTYLLASRKWDEQINDFVISIVCFLSKHLQVEASHENNCTIDNNFIDVRGRILHIP